MLPSAELLEDTWEEALALFRTAKALKEEARSKDDLELALAKYEQALQKFVRLGKDNEAGATLHNMANVYQSLGQHDQAVQVYQQSLSVFKKIGQVAGVVSSLSHMGAAHGSLGQHQMALELYQQALAIQRELGDVAGENESLDKMASAYYSLGQYQKALDLYDQVLAIQRKIGDVAGESHTLNDMSIVCRSLDQNQKALKLSEQSLAISKNLGDVAGEGRGLMNMGTVYQSLGQYRKALEVYEQALTIFRKQRDVDKEGDSLNNMALLYNSLGHYERALDLCEQALFIFRKQGNVDGEGDSLNNMALACESLGNHQKALELYEQALAIKRRIGNIFGMAKILVNISGLYLTMGEIRVADAYVKELPPQFGLEVGARLALLKSDFEKARVSYYEMLVAGKRSGRHDLLFEGHTGLGLALEGSGNYTVAAEHFRKAVGLSEKVRDSLPSALRQNFSESNVMCLPRAAAYEGLSRVQLKMGELGGGKQITEKEFDRFRDTEKAGGNESIVVKTLEDAAIPTHLGDASEATSHERAHWYTWIDGFLIGPISQQGLCDIVMREADDSEDLRAIGPFSAEELRDMGVPESSLENPILDWRPTPPEVGSSDIAGQGESRRGGLQKRNPKVWKHARDIPFLSELIS